MAIQRLTESVNELQTQIAGTILTPDAPDYDKIRRGWNLAVDHHPALVLIAENVQDVVEGVRFAGANGLGVGIQSTGHGQHLPSDDALLIITSRMTGVQVDVEARTAKAEAGAIWKHVIDVATPHGLAPLLGSSPHVGVIGYTLGGGFGWLGRRYGLAADSVTAIGVVTPDATLRHASPSENSDLFWGLLGGGGNFGVVTAIEFKLYPVATIYGGTLIYPGELAKDTLRFFRDWVKTAPDELTSSITVLKIPAMPSVPEPMRGKVMVFVRATYTGNADDGKAFIQKWLDWHEPENNSFHEMPFSEIGTVSNDPTDPTPGLGTNEMLDNLSDEAIDIIVRNTTKAGSPLVFSEIRHAGGAIARVNPAANAIGNRDAVFYLTLNSLLTSPDMFPVIRAAVESYKGELKPYLRGGVYLNFMAGSEGRYRTKDAYLPKSFERLVALKAKYDPENMFRFSFQLVPVSA